MNSLTASDGDFSNTTAAGKLGKVFGLLVSHSLRTTSLDDELHGRLEKAEIVMPRSKSPLGDVLRDCILERNDVKPATKEARGQVVNDLTACFSEDRDVRSLNPGNAEDFKQSLAGRGWQIERFIFCQSGTGMRCRGCSAGDSGT